MADLSPLKAVYEFFQTGQTSASVRRFRYTPGTTVTGINGLRERGTPAQSIIQVFRVPSDGEGRTRGDTRELDPRGADAAQTRIVYTTADLRTTNANEDQVADVIVDEENFVWLVVAVNDWRQAEGYQVTIEATRLKVGEALFGA